ncbi:hypothetical protein Q9R38_28280 [Priestia aryabhattai]|uniref:hypothetical protein n=1 Tax=Priestia aryabhattai TaxID=412384 RepID=UPI0028811729|nr:hypothetical protein [Priestia aryabhattai]MDT0150417.1 hypothetical protein [Priestia aryabhattai]MDT0155976.1 hypothetical protein [Priestia aryabhattai]
MDITKMTELLKSQGLTDEVINKILEHASQQKNASEWEGDYFNVKQASAYLQDKLDKSWNPPKVRRFITSGQLQTINQVDPKGQTGSPMKEGYLISKQALETFIEDQSKTKEDWKQEALKLREEVQALKTNGFSPKEEGSSPRLSSFYGVIFTDFH